METLLDNLKNSSEPVIRYKFYAYVIGKDQSSTELARLRQDIKKSTIVKALLAEQKKDGSIPHSSYKKWYGAHWILVALADIDYPQDDKSLYPIRDKVYEWLLSDKHLNAVKTLNGRVRRCASQEGNAIYSTVKLGIADERAGKLAENLIKWQWPDGGWNCDKNLKAKISSFHESLIPMRGLYHYGIKFNNKKAIDAAMRTSEIFLSRRLFRRKRDGKIMHEDFTKMAFPSYWHYDFFFALKVLNEMHLLNDPRCKEALTLLESKQRKDGGFPAEKKYYSTSTKKSSGRSPVGWGVQGNTRTNDFVTIDALHILKEAESAF